LCVDQLKRTGAAPSVSLFNSHASYFLSLCKPKNSQPLGHILFQLNGFENFTWFLSISTLILYSHLHAGIQTCRFPSDFPYYILIVISRIRAMCCTHCTPFYKKTPLICSEKYKLRNSSWRDFSLFLFVYRKEQLTGTYRTLTETYSKLQLNFKNFRKCIKKFYDCMLLTIFKFNPLLISLQTLLIYMFSGNSTNCSLFSNKCTKLYRNNTIQNPNMTSQRQRYVQFEPFTYPWSTMQNVMLLSKVVDKFLVHVIRNYPLLKASAAKFKLHY